MITADIEGNITESLLGRAKKSQVPKKLLTTSIWESFANKLWWKSRTGSGTSGGNSFDIEACTTWDKNNAVQDSEDMSVAETGNDQSILSEGKIPMSSREERDQWIRTFEVRH